MGMLDWLFGDRTKYHNAPQLPSPKQLEEQKKKELRAQQQQDLENRLTNLDRFPGSLSEYIALKREEGLDYSHIVVPMSTGRPEKFVHDPKHTDDIHINFTSSGERKLLIYLIANGCIGLIRYEKNYNSGLKRAYGIPVKIKTNNYRK